MTGMPELGSKISLISKADIRYEGRLFTVDPQECTIALANVRSFGTEERETPYPIMPQPTVYDYILFRGSDIKDIRVVNNVVLPNDPAIMQMHLPPQPNNFPQQSLPQFAGGPPQMNQFANFGPMQGGPMGPNMPLQSQQQQAQSPIQSQHQGNNNSNLAPGSGSGHKNKKSSESNKKEMTSEKSATVKSTGIRKQSNKSQDSRSGTPQNLSRKSPTSEGNQMNQNQRESQSGSGKDKPQRNNNQRNQQRERRDSGRNEAQENKGYRNQNQNQRPNNQMNNNHHQGQQQQPGQQQRGYNRNNNGNMNQQQMRGNQGGSARMRGPPMNQNYQRPQHNQGAPIQNQNKSNNGQQQTRPVSKPLKFENEFDFESANSKFEELRTQLALLKVGAEETKSTDQVNGEVEKKDDSGNETGADHEAEADDNGYDKNKSFFDNISCEAVERSKGKTQRTDWRQERKINSETFGYAFNRRGNYRGRGGYYNNQYNRGPRPGGFRGPNPNYRPMRTNHRNPNVEGRSNVSSTNNQASGQQSQNQAAAVAAN